MKPGRRALETLLPQCGITLKAEQLDALWAHHQMILDADPALNPDRRREFESLIHRHYVGNLWILKFLSLPSSLIDISLGPFPPGIPLKIASPKTKIILAEPRPNQARLLAEFCEKLNLTGIEVRPRKLDADHPARAQGVIARTDAPIPETLNRAAAAIKPGGLVIIMRDSPRDPEAQRFEDDRFRLKSDQVHNIPGTSLERRLIVYERTEAIAEAPGKPPDRRAGLVHDISSESNATYRRFLDLLSGRGVRKHGQAILAGKRIIDEVQEQFADHVLGWITDPKGPAPTDPSWTWHRLAPSLFKTIDVAGARSPLLLVRTPEIPEWSDEAPWPDGCALFIPFQDPENVGAVIRSAAAFGVPRVVLLQEAAHPFHPKSSRAAGPALFQTELMRGPSARALKSASHPLISLDAGGDEIGERPFPKTFGLVIGLEGPGLPDHLRRGERRRIAMAPGVESLNAATAAAVALYVWSRGSQS